MEHAVAHVNTSIGEAVIYIGEAQHLLRPSFRALQSVGNSEDLEYSINAICNAYQVLLSGLVPKPTDIACCGNMLDACSDLTFDSIGQIVPSVKNGLRWKAGKLPYEDVVILAHHCIKWGVYGEPKEKLTRQAKKKMAQEEQRPFDPAEFVAILIDEFGLSSQDAWNSTMTEFQRLCEHRNRKNWGDRPPPIDDEERDKLLDGYQAFLKNKQKLKG